MLLAARCKYRTQKSRQKSPSGHHCTTSTGYIFAKGMYRQSEKNLLSSNMSSTCFYNMVNFGPLAAEIGSLVWGAPANFNCRVSRLGSVTARHSSIGRQPNFAALNRGRHLYSAWQPSRWASAHILLMAALWNRAIIFSCCDLLLLFFFFFSSPNLSGRGLDVYHTSTHGVSLVRI